MNLQHTLRTAARLLAPAAAITIAACSNPENQPSEQITMVEAPDGAAIVETIKTNGLVTQIDATNRRVTLKMADGRITSVKCGPEAVNFRQIEIGDRVDVTVTEELAVYLGRGSDPSASAAAGVALAPIGSKPSGVIAETVQVTATITAIDANSRMVTLALPDGTTKGVRAGSRVDLNTLKPGDNVTVRYTEAVAINVRKA